MSDTWPTGAATGAGTLPGTDIGEAVRTVAGELPDLPFLPRLPDRGVGADPAGTAIGLLVDLFAEVVPSGWRLSSRPGVDLRRATDTGARTADAAEEFLTGAPRLLVPLLGPLSLAARLELSGGTKAIGDHGALTDLAESLAEGLRRRLVDLQARLPGTELVVRVDEPELPAVVDALVPTPSGFGTLRSVPASTVRDVLRRFTETVDVATMFGAGIPTDRWDLLTGTGLEQIRVCRVDDVAGDSGTAVADAIGQAVQDGGRLLVLLGELAGAAGRDDTDGVAQALAKRILTGWSRIGFDHETLRRSVFPSAGNLHRLSATAARDALTAARQVGALLTDPPDTQA